MRRQLAQPGVQRLARQIHVEGQIAHLQAMGQDLKAGRLARRLLFLLLLGLV
jgi:hypothetical protein